jgi:tetratricopeptide (TPR) repeat protein
MKKTVTTILTIILAVLIGVTGLVATGVLKLNTELFFGKIEPAQKTVAPKISTTNQSPELEKPASILPPIIDNPPTFEEHMKKGDAFAAQNQYTFAYNEYAIANKINPQALEPFIQIGKLHLKRKDADRAREIFQQILVKQSGNIEVTGLLIDAFILGKKPEKALEVANTIPDKNQRILYDKGILSAYFGKYTDSKNYLTEAIAINTDSTLTTSAQKFIKSYETFAASQGSQLIYLKTLLGKNLNEAGQYTLSIPLLFDVVKEKKDYRDAWILLGYAYINLEDGKNAEDALKQAKAIDPYKPETLFFLGLAHQLKNESNQAIENIEEAIKKGFEPKIQAQQKLADLYLEAGAYEKAAAKYEEVIKLNSDDITYFIRPIFLYIEKLQSADRAIALAQKAVQKHPNEAMSYNLLGWALMSKKDYQAARDNLAKAVQMDPKLSAAYLNLGKLFEEIKYPQTAKDYYKTAFDLGKGTSVGDSAGQRYNQLMQANTLSKP